MGKMHELAHAGTAVWFDYIKRSFTRTGKLGALVKEGVRGVTSNPSIFEKAIGQSDDYDEQLKALVAEGLEVEEIYEALAVEDIRAAADVLRPVFEDTGGEDGYVSLEVSPRLAYDTDATVAEGLRLFSELHRPNIMIKVPATTQGVEAIERLTAEGVNVNATLMFSVQYYEAVANAYVSGLEALAAKGKPVNHVASVASFFVSRIDKAVDDLLDTVDDKAAAKDLKGRIAIDNARLAYQSFKAIFSGERWDALAARGARVQRPLWASTSTKNPEYRDVLYVETLIGPHTVNTVPPDTLDAFIDHGEVAVTMEEDVKGARARFAELARVGVDFNAVTDKLLDDGVKSFADAFDALLASVARRRAELSTANPLQNYGPYKRYVQASIAAAEKEGVERRLLAHDHTLWSESAEEIENRLGWVEAHKNMRSELERVNKLREDLEGEGITGMLLLGMGGSSLAPEVFGHSFPEAKGLGIAVADTTVPGAISALLEENPPARTLYVVSTKSGGTAETLSLFKYFYRKAVASLGPDEAPKHFVAITDPGSSLEALAKKLTLREVFVNDPNFGGRYAALSLVGLVPAGLAGIDTARLLDAAQATYAEMAMPVRSSALEVGVALGALAAVGRDKLTLICSPELASFADWIEQLVAESTGKEGRGILPVVGEVPGPPAVYGDDRVFVSLTIVGDNSFDEALAALEGAGHPVVRFKVRDNYGLGAQFLMWEAITAIAGHVMGVHPFNQPDVESAKVGARQMLERYKESGTMEAGEPVLRSEEADAYGDVSGDDVRGALGALIAGKAPGHYVALQAYVAKTPEVDLALGALCEELRRTTRMAVTVGYGPRFLHSTGQLHKGDAGKGLFVQFTAADPVDLDIPDTADSDASSIAFGALKLSQALGDGAALRDKGRKVLRYHVKADVAAFINSLI